MGAVPHERGSPLSSSGSPGRSTYFGFGEEVRTLYITNGAFPFFPSTGHGPSLLKVQLDVPGYHFPQLD